MKTLKKISTLLFILFFVSTSIFPVPLNQLRIVAEDGTFLGTFENEYSSKSVYNQYGNYGSPYSSNSIMNKYGTYGSDYSDYSPFNKYANNAPWIVDGYGDTYGRLSINKYATGVTNDSYKIALQLKALRDSF
ncbi:MAG: hypothetical protein J5631_12055 [Spirochaetaceae bacterium]|nr:hypothetical protein [Spirochaetaceae bacterium]